MLLNIKKPLSLFSGRFFLHIYNTETGEVRTHEQENLVTDWGLEAMATTGTHYISQCRVGSGSAEPAYSDTTLVNEIARVGPTGKWPFFHSNSSGAVQAVYDTSDINNIHVYADLPFVFPKGAAAGNISELGMGNGNGLFSRTLIRDVDGNPTSITVLDIEVLTVTYRHRHHVPNESWVQENVEIGGNKPWTGKVTCSPIRVGGSRNHWDTQSQYGHLIQAGELRNVANGLTAHEQDTPYPITQFIVGSGGGGTQNGTYIGNLVAEHTAFLGINQGNFPLGIGTITAQLGGLSYQFQFEPRIPKTNLDELSLVFRHTWGRYEEEEETP